jgi:hypothetical protein
MLKRRVNMRWHVQDSANSQAKGERGMKKEIRSNEGQLSKNHNLVEGTCNGRTSCLPAIVSFYLPVFFGFGIFVWIPVLTTRVPSTSTRVLRCVFRANFGRRKNTVQV